METWVSIRGFEGLYEVSDLGNVKSMKRIIPNSSSGPRFIKERIMRPSKDKDGYRRLKLRKDGRIFYKRVNILVASEFVKNPFGMPLVNHKNGNKEDDSATNLEWTDNLGNMIHAREVLGHKKNYGKRIGQYDLHGNLIKDWDTLQAISNAGYSHSDVRRCLKEEARVHANFRWEYIDKGCPKPLSENDKIKFSRKNGLLVKVKQLSLSGILIKEWDSVTEAAKSFNSSASNISRAACGRRVKAFGFKWAYSNEYTMPEIRYVFGVIN